MRSTSFINFAISSHQLTCPIGQICARGFSLQEKKKRTLPDSEAPFLTRCLPAFSKWLEANVADWMIFLRFAARTANPDMPKDELKRFSSHSGRVWALVLLDKAGMTPDFMKSYLHWMGDSYRLYLQDTSILQQKHVEALIKDSNEIQRLLGRNCDILPNIVSVDNEMEDY
jgi:hypothetical protein